MVGGVIADAHCVHQRRRVARSSSRISGCDRNCRRRRWLSIATLKSARVERPIVATAVGYAEISGFVENREERERSDRFLLRVHRFDAARVEAKPDRVRLSVRKSIRSSHCRSERRRWPTIARGPLWWSPPATRRPIALRCWSMRMNCARQARSTSRAPGKPSTSFAQIRQGRTGLGPGVQKRRRSGPRRPISRHRATPRRARKTSRRASRKINSGGISRPTCPGCAHASAAGCGPHRPYWRARARSRRRGAGNA